MRVVSSNGDGEGVLVEVLPEAEVRCDHIPRRAHLGSRQDGARVEEAEDVEAHLVGEAIHEVKFSR